MKRRSWVKLAFFLGIPLVSAVGFVIIMQWLFRGDWESQSAIDHYHFGINLEAVGRFEDAVPQYKFFLKYAESRGEYTSEVKADIGHCLDVVGKSEEARKFIDESLATTIRGFVCVYKAQNLARTGSQDDAVVWLEAVSLPPIEHEK